MVPQCSRDSVKNSRADVHFAVLLTVTSVMSFCVSCRNVESCCRLHFGPISALQRGRSAWRIPMKKSLAVATLVLAASVAAAAKDPVFYQTGRLTQMHSVSCGFTENSGKSFFGEVVGTDGGHVKNKELLCQEYVLKTDKVMFHIRPKEEKHPVLLPIGEDAKFRIKKDHLLLQVPEIGGKEAEYIVTSMTQINPDPQHAETAKLGVPESAK
jgi:hypothetical protein